MPGEAARSAESDAEDVSETLVRHLIQDGVITGGHVLSKEMSSATKWALCQCEAMPPDPDVLASAFVRASGLTSLDAKLAALQGYGVLADKLEEETSRNLRAHLAEHGYECVVVHQSDLELPRAYHLRRADLSASCLIVYDVYGRPSEIPWSALLLAHVGLYPQGELVTTKEAGWEHVGDEYIVAWDAEHEYVETDQIILELVFGAPLKRYTITPAPFDYRFLEDRKRSESRENFALLLGDLVRLVPGSIPSASFRLATDRLGLAELRRYPSRRLFERHLMWLAWRALRST